MGFFFKLFSRLFFNSDTFERNVDAVTSLSRVYTFFEETYYNLNYKLFFVRIKFNLMLENFVSRTDGSIL